MSPDPKQQAPAIQAPVNLALQGGGSHGAFTWGVLDALLEDGSINFEGISGTSAGAMNAVAMAHGFAQAQAKARPDPREAAREALKSFWDGIVRMGALGNALTAAERAPFSLLFGPCGSDYSPAASWMNAMSAFWSSTLSPYQSNPLDINPLRHFVAEQIDFEAIAHASKAGAAPKVFVVATEVRSGKAEVFSGQRLTLDAVMASACLPTLFRAVEIEGLHYWDGGYCGNPAIHPLIYQCRGRDIVLVQINPIRRDELPTHSAQIMDRINEVTFNAGLVAEMRAIDFVKRLLAEGKLDPAHYKDVLMHRIDGGAELDAFGASSKTSTDAALIQGLHNLGRSHAQAWLSRHSTDLGQRSSIDIKRDYLDDLRMPVHGD